MSIDAPKLDAYVTIKIDEHHTLSISEVFGRNQTEMAILKHGDIVDGSVRRVSNTDILQDYLFEWLGDKDV